MNISRTSIDGLFVIESEHHKDERGSFTRVFDRDVFLAHGLSTDFIQHSIARNPRKGTLRGLHYQVAPFGESKVVQCFRGHVWDVVLDVRRASATFGLWQAFELWGEGTREIYIGPGLAHGYVTLSDDTDLHYLVSPAYSPDHAAGVHYLDRDADISWPLSDVIVSARDSSLPPLKNALEPGVPSQPRFTGEPGTS